MSVRRVQPGPGQESVWDYPRPPRLEDSGREVVILARGEEVARTWRPKRVLETSHPPVYYVPPEDVTGGRLQAGTGASWCEWKGRAAYHDLLVGDERIQNAAWYYPRPTREFASLAGYLAFYPALMDACYVDGELVRAQAGGFYGGWVTGEVVGPFKGEPGTWGW